VLVFRELSRTDDAGTVTTVDLLIGKPESFTDATTGFDGFRCAVQILGLQPNPSPAPIEKGFLFFESIALDPLDALLKAVHTARVTLDATPEGKAGKLAWKNMPQIPGYGLPKKVIELTDFIRDNYVNMSPHERSFWDGLLSGVPIAKSGMVVAAYQSQTWQQLQSAPVTALQSVTAVDAQLLARVGIHTVAELAAYLPARVAQTIVHVANPKNPILD
jgi:hypothetical protein